MPGFGFFCGNLLRLANRGSRLAARGSGSQARKIASSSLLRRASKGRSKGGVDPLSNVSAGTESQATAESAGASARYHTQDGRHPGKTVFSELLSGVACVPSVTVKMVGKILRFSDV